MGDAFSSASICGARAMNELSIEQDNVQNAKVTTSKVRAFMVMSPEKIARDPLHMATDNAGVMSGGSEFQQTAFIYGRDLRRVPIAFGTLLI